LGGVNVKNDPYIFGLDGYATPFFYRQGNEMFLLVGSVSGKIFQFQVSSPVTAFTKLNDNVNLINEGAQSAVWFEDINNDGKRDLFIGNASGGLAVYSSASPFVGLQPSILADAISIFPNP